VRTVLAVVISEYAHGTQHDSRRDLARTRQQRKRERDNSVTVTRDNERDTSESPIPIVGTPVSSSVLEAPKKPALIQGGLGDEQLAKAKTMLVPDDYEFLKSCPNPYKNQWLSDPEWWISLRDGYPKIDVLVQASRYMAWEGAKRKRDHRAALRNWIAKADRWREGDEMRKAVRR